MRIAHISDLHIRNFKYRDEYRKAFEDLYAKLAELKPDLIVNTGDTVHSKLAVSPELFDDVTQHMLRVSTIAPYWLTLGNHDLNLKNKTRTDAISPVVRAIQGRTVNEVQLLGPGMHIPPMQHTRFRFWNYDIRGHEPFEVPSGHINVGMYHGSVGGCVTDMGFAIEDPEAEVERFDQMDYVMLGDIHKRQSFRNGKMWYPGSLIQQNYGEELVKGFLLWDIFDRTHSVVDFHPIETTGRFYTVQVAADLKADVSQVPQGSRIKAIVNGELTPSKRIELEKMIREAIQPIEVIIPDCSDEKVQSAVPDIDELIGSREKVMRDWLAERGMSETDADEVVKLFLEYEGQLDSDGTARGTSWQLKKISWDNMMNYGEENSIDLEKVSGLVGIFAPNASGKSSIFDIMLQALFDKISKEVPRNIDLVNDNKDVGTMGIEFEAGGQPYAIERTIERIHYGQRKFTETKQWGKTSLDFSSVDESLNGTTRPETEKSIRQLIGTFEDFCLTTMVSQNPVFGLPGGGDILNCRETDRRKILFRFLDLDAYERIASAVKDDLKELMGKYKGLDRETLETNLEKTVKEKDRIEAGISVSRAELTVKEQMLDEMNQLLTKLNVESGLTLLGQLATATNAVEANSRLLQHTNMDIKRVETSLLDQWAAKGRLLKDRPTAPSVPLEELRDSINKVRSDRESVAANLSRDSMKRDRGVKSLKTLDEVPCEGKYPTCKFISEASSFVLERKDVEDAIDQLTEKSDVLNIELSRLDDMYVVHKHVLDWERDLSKVELEISRLNNVQTSATTERDRLRAIDAELNAKLLELQAQMAAFEAEDITGRAAERAKLAKFVKDRRTEIDRMLKSVGAIDSQIDQIKESLATLDGLRERVLMHERLLEMCGKNGLPYRILALVLPVINAEIAKILGGIVKFSVFFEDDPEEQTVSLYIRYGDYKSRPLSLGSGAEKFISSLAIRAALLSVSSLPKTDLLIIDEGFGKLDPEYLEALQRMFEYLKEAFGTVFIVSHVDFMRDIVDHSIEIASRDGYAHVEVT